jgi:YD repeat-containing protein
VRMLRKFMILSLFLLGATHVSAGETITYTYDAKGRLVRVVRTGTVNNNLTTEYTHDKANNRVRVKTINSPNVPPPP